MARQAKQQDDISFVERHVEKMVLAAAVGLLLFAVVHWVLSSPRRVPLTSRGARPALPSVRAGADGVPPEQADGVLLQAAQDLARKHVDPRDHKFKLPDHISHLDFLRKRPFGDTPMIAWGQPRAELLDEGPPPPDDIKRGMKVRVADLEKLAPAPSTPEAEVYRELADTAAGPKEWYVIRPAATYSLADVTDAWRKKLERIILRNEPIRPIAIEIEVRAADDVDADWDAIKALPAKSIRLPGRIMGGLEMDQPLDDFPAVPESCDEETIEKVQADLMTINDNLAELFNTDFYSILDDSGREWVSWQKNLPPGPVKETGGDRGAAGVGVIPPRGGVVPRRGGVIPRRGGVIRPRGGTVPPRGTPTQPRRRPSGSLRGAPPRETTRSPRGAPPRSGTVRRPPATAAKTGEAEPADVPVAKVPLRPAPLGAQLEAGKILIWAHDVAGRPGKVYRYRIRVKLKNPLLGHEKDMHEDYLDQAWLTTANTPWSEWSKPVRVVRPIDFFLVHSKRTSLIGPRANTGTVRVAVFTQRLGQLVSHEFVVSQGDPIGQKVTKTLRNPPPGLLARAAAAAKVAAGQKPLPEPAYSNQEVDFSTGAVTVEVDFQKSVFKVGQEAKTTEVVYLDEKGRLGSCLWTKNLPAQCLRRILYDKLQKEIDAAKAEAAAAAAAAAEAG